MKGHTAKMIDLASQIMLYDLLKNERAYSLVLILLLFDLFKKIKGHTA
jgi:hypothetical protein